MKRAVVVLASDELQSETLCAMLTEKDFRPVPISDPAEATNSISETSCLALILDLDSISATNIMLRDLKKKHDITIIAVSERKLHPELAESMGSHIFASLVKPVDPDDLEYLLKGVFE